MRPLLLLTTVAIATGLAACGGSGAGEGEVEATAARTTIATGLQVPWGIAFLPGGDALVAERTTGRIIRIKRGTHRKRVVMRVPGVDTDAGEGGLLGLAVSPRYKRDRLVYAYFTSGSDNRIVRFKLGGKPKADPHRPARTRSCTTAGASPSGPTASCTRASASR